MRAGDAHKQETARCSPDDGAERICAADHEGRVASRLVAGVRWLAARAAGLPIPGDREMLVVTQVSDGDDVDIATIPLVRVLELVQGEDAKIVEALMARPRARRPVLVLVDGLAAVIHLPAAAAVATGAL